MQSPVKVHCPLPSPAVGYVTDVGGPAGQEDLTGIEGLSLLCCSSEHLNLRLGYCICGGAEERSGLQGCWGESSAQSVFYTWLDPLLDFTLMYLPPADSLARYPEPFMKWSMSTSSLLSSLPSPLVCSSPKHEVLPQPSMPLCGSSEHISALCILFWRKGLRLYSGLFSYSESSCLYLQNAAIAGACHRTRLYPFPSCPHGHLLCIL